MLAGTAGSRDVLNSDAAPDAYCSPVTHAGASAACNATVGCGSGWKDALSLSARHGSSMGRALPAAQHAKLSCQAWARFMSCATTSCSCTTPPVSMSMTLQNSPQGAYMLCVGVQVPHRSRRPLPAATSAGQPHRSHTGSSSSSSTCRWWWPACPRPAAAKAASGPRCVRSAAAAVCEAYTLGARASPADPSVQVRYPLQHLTCQAGHCNAVL